ncbi:MAG: MerR family transcriptional regulator [Bacteroidetes bacterium HGW-Bacteroidetes-2]|jgi:hypothetical protein|nr:MAG: MerR family transcriptional regulator [Bacteroidetes bacterium HGW-Bacteroidetes-2]
MEKQNFITIETICKYHNVPVAFILSLGDFDLIEIQIINSEPCILQSQLVEVEKYVRLHNDLEINSEGLSAICHLIQRLEVMQEQITQLKMRLELYEDNIQ